MRRVKDLPEAFRTEAQITCLSHAEIAPFSLLQDFANSAKVAAPPVSTLPKGNQSWSFLVVDDSHINQKILVMQLKKLGHQAEAVSNGREAIEQVRRKIFDMILMDCLMPEMDGTEAARRIRELEGTAKHTRIVAVTAGNLPEVGPETGSVFDDGLEKPYQMEQLQALIERVLGNL